MVRKLLATSVTQTDSTAIAVEFLEPIGEEDSAASSQPVLPPSKGSQTSQPVEDKATQTTLSTPAISLGGSPAAPTPPITEPSAPLIPRKASIPTMPPNKTAASPPIDTPTLNSRPKRPAATAPPTTDNSAIQNPVPADAVTSNIRLPDVLTVPNPPDTPPQANPNGAIASIAIPSSSTPAQFTAQFRAIGSTTDPSNSAAESTTSAQLLGETTKLFSSDPSICVLTPEAFHNFGQPVMLKLPLSETGTFNPQKRITVEQSSGNIYYDELAICVTKTAHFTPSYKLEGITKRAISSELEIQVTLVQ
jgi:hypothetical protein